ncbi:tRNA pseudouridine(13) synthase TruD [Shewanella sp. SNU WT4]|uniref:tRNA pseudouridine(13) synthase TruD n=1 Tax=Shewanella sp. SNU WT4 TaxID=2590015 RepID=UPI00112D05BF|nr:tRNA pseudouridine(13) synthase TruD [Shewanella sp. SNU WT4]QDF68600.1 tRNA pseudouridine(13) synthase TruD [Shewanella sp. SNU WT4]
MNSLTYLHGKPAITVDIRTENADFQVQEILPFLPSGEGEHHLLHIRKNGLTTVMVAKLLAEFAKVHPKEVTYAGQKDKNAITEQWFGVRIPGKDTPEWAQLNSDEITILASSRHGKKLRIGALSGNRFQLVLRQVSDVDALLERVAVLAETGVPNYFGEQRFGHNGSNLRGALAMFGGRKVKDRNKRSMYLSASRSDLFNQVVSSRLAQHGTQPLTGDCVMLSGSRSFFTVELWDDTLTERLAEKDIQLSAPLWGRGALPSQADALALEQAALVDYAAHCNGLEQAGLDQERRTLLLRPEGLKAKALDNDTVQLEFMLPAGCFATAVLRELCEYQDVQEMQFQALMAEKDKLKQEAQQDADPS